MSDVVPVMSIHPAEEVSAIYEGRVGLPFVIGASWKPDMAAVEGGVRPSR
jgi:hypothetical protein